MAASIVFLPAAPALDPVVAAGAAAELDETRAAVAAAVLGRTRASSDSATPGLDGSWGVVAPDQRAAITATRLVGAIADTGLAREPAHVVVRPFPPPSGAADWATAGAEALAADMVAADPDVEDCWFVVGDGTACRTDKAPGYWDARAETVDSRIARALATGDHRGLGNLDRRQCAELLVAGWPVWQALSHVLSHRCPGVSVRDPRLLHASAPYGVGYFVARWTVESDPIRGIPSTTGPDGADTAPSPQAPPEQPQPESDESLVPRSS